jgi:anti-sigma B factor antagonist
VASRFQPAISDTPFELRSVLRGEMTVIDVEGEIDLATADELIGAVERVESRVARVVVNLTGVSFLDSSALNALIRCQRLLEARDIGLRVVSPGSVVRRVFEITRTVERLQVVNSLDDGLA